MRMASKFASANACGYPSQPKKGRMQYCLFENSVAREGDDGIKKARKPFGCGLNPILEEIGGDGSNYIVSCSYCPLFFRNNRYKF
jgi:hypothetical protein